MFSRSRMDYTLNAMANDGDTVPPLHTTELPDTSRRAPVQRVIGPGVRARRGHPASRWLHLPFPTGHAQDELLTSLPENLGHGDRPSPKDGVRHSHTVWGTGNEVARRMRPSRARSYSRGIQAAGG